MQPEIRPYRQDAEFFTDELCHINELSNTESDPDASIAYARVEPGISTRWHRLHGTTERYVILSGQGLVEIGDLAPQTVRHGDVILIPPLCRQRISNTGQDDLIFLAICTPRFMQVLYEEIDDNLNDLRM